MDVIEAIFTRRSIRKFTKEHVPDELITDLIKAAMQAPSAGNQQPWHFVVISNRKILDTIPSFHPYADMLPQVSVAVVVCGDPTLEKHRGFWIEDCSAATQNLLLAAHAKGLGAVWVSLYPEMSRADGMRKLLKLPEQIIPLSLIPLGYPAEQIEHVDRYNPTRVHWYPE